ncbi:MAG TPA: SufD family Fe-S cluster assembly protein, partial [Pyrinomonadaceae bacterium]
MATQIAKEQSRYAEAFRALRERGVEPGWLNRLRADAFERFEHLGFPTTDLEDWKYTNIAPIARTECAPVKEREEISSDFAAAFEQFTYRESARSQLVFLNGVYQPRLSSTDALAAAGAVALDLAEALKSDAHSTVLREHLSRVADYKEHALVALNTALFSGGALLYVPRGVKVEAPVHLLFLSDSQADNMPSLSSPRVLVVAERGADVIVIESYAASGEGAYWTNAVTEIVLADEARAVYYRVQREAADAFHTATTK